MLKFLNKWKPWILAGIPFIGFGVLLGTYPGYRTYTYAWNNANFCVNCHVHDYANVSWKNSIHGDVTTCHDCHHQPLRQYIIELFAMVPHPPKFPQDLKHMPNISKELCQSCHIRGADHGGLTGPLSSKDIEPVPKVNELYLHQLHLTKKTKTPLPSQFHLESEGEYGKVSETPNVQERSITCMDCHGGPPNRGHHFTAVDTSCVRCHSGIHDSKIPKKVGCRDCHFQSFLIPIKEEKMFKSQNK